MISSKIYDGFLLGLGFSIPFSIFYALTTVVTTNYMMSDYRVENEAPNYGITIENMRIEEAEGKYIVIGEVTNTLDRNQSLIYLEAEFFGDNNLFIDKCSGRLGGELMANSTRNFRIRCESPIFNYETYSVKVIDVSNY
ncbi:MAG: hypothetical protein ABW139_15155 [Candidatus Thiodiazotropha sp. DIVDIV]